VCGLEGRSARFFFLERRGVCALTARGAYCQEVEVDSSMPPYAAFRRMPFGG
jgi:hypothetical protein